MTGTIISELQTNLNDMHKFNWITNEAESQVQVLLN